MRLWESRGGLLRLLEVNRSAWEHASLIAGSCGYNARGAALAGLLGGLVWGAWRTDRRAYWCFIWRGCTFQVAKRMDHPLSEELPMLA